MIASLIIITMVCGAEEAGGGDGLTEGPQHDPQGRNSDVPDEPKWARRALDIDPKPVRSDRLKQRPDRPHRGRRQRSGR